MLHNFLNPIKQQQLISATPQSLCLLLSTSSSQPRFTLGFSWESPSPALVAAISRLLYSSGRVAPGETQVGADHGLHHLGNPRASAPSGQLQTMSENHHPAPAQLIFHRGQKLVVNGHSQSLKLTGLGKTLPDIFQQQPRLTYKSILSPHSRFTWSTQLG